MKDQLLILSDSFKGKQEIKRNRADLYFCDVSLFSPLKHA